MSDEWQPVKLAAKVIGHISQGMYRTPAGAIKELISNAYDAGATHVKIHTGFPLFAEFSCEDNGTGIHRAEFERLMNGGIGDSHKQATEDGRIGYGGRPIIGRLGVGLLSLAQICSRFTIVSHHEKTRTAFQASIKFPPYTRKQIDREIQEAESEKRPLIKTGQYKIDPIDYEQTKKGLTVNTSFIRETFRRTMGDLSRYRNAKSNKRKSSYQNFEKFLSSIANSKLKALFFASPYDQLLFGLALASPLPYPEEGETRPCILQVPELEKLQQRLLSYQFSLEIDNIQMRRPVILPSDGEGTLASACVVSRKSTRAEFNFEDGPHKETTDIERYLFSVRDSDLVFQLYSFEYSEIVNGHRLSFKGYAFGQTTRLFPKEYQGVLIRLRNVAIGQYDSSFLTYPQAEGPRFAMVSSEIFVEEGLDDALKVDRDGFNTLDPHYLRLQAYVHGLLHEKVFPGLWAEEKPRNEKRRRSREKQSLTAFSKRVKDTTDGKVSTVVVKTEKVESSSPPVVIDSKTNKLTVYESHPDVSTVLKKKKFKGVAAQVIAAFELINLELDSSKRRELFYKLIEGIFNE